MTLIDSPKSIGEILILSWQGFKNSWLKLLPFGLVSGFIVAFWINWHAINTELHLIYTICFTVFLLLLQIFIFAFLIYRANQVNTKPTSEQSSQNAFLFTARKFFVYLITSFFYYIIIILSAIIFVIPGIFLSVLFSLFLVAILIDNEGIFSSLKCSARLVWGNWWHTFICFFTFGFISGLAAFIVASLFRILMVHIFHGTETQANAAYATGTFIIASLQVIYYANLLLNLYYELKIRVQQKTVPIQTTTNSSENEVSNVSQN